MANAKKNIMRGYSCLFVGIQNFHRLSNFVVVCVYSWLFVPQMNSKPYNHKSQGPEYVQSAQTQSNHPRTLKEWGGLKLQ